MQIMTTKDKKIDIEASTQETCIILKWSTNMYIYIRINNKISSSYIVYMQSVVDISGLEYD